MERYNLTFSLAVSGITPKSRAHHGLTSTLRNDNAIFSTSSLDMKSLLTHFFLKSSNESPPKIRTRSWQARALTNIRKRRIFKPVSSLISEKYRVQKPLSEINNKCRTKKNQNKTLNTRQWQTQIQLIHRVIVQHFTITPYISPRFIFNYTRPERVAMAYSEQRCWFELITKKTRVNRWCTICDRCGTLRDTSQFLSLSYCLR